MTSRELTKAQLIEELEELRRQHETLVIENFEQKIVEGILLESKEWLQHIIQQMPFPIEVSASDGSTTLVNEAFLQIFNYNNIDDVLNRYNVFNDPLYAPLLEDIKKVYKGEKMFSAELVTEVNSFKNFGHLKMDDGKVILEVIMFPLVSLAGEVRRVVKFWKDITGYKKAEALLKKEQINLEELVKERTRELAKANSAKDKFFSLISHDLKSPFNGMLGITNILMEDYDTLSKEEIKPFVENLRSSTNKIYRLIDNLLEWSNIMMDRVSYNPEEINLFEEALYAIMLVKQNAEDNGIKIINNIPENLAAYADHNMIQSALSRLINNAVRFNKPGGSVVLEGKKEQDFAFVTIKDTGKGMDEGKISNLFRIDVNTKTFGLDNESGSGLGLIISKELIEKNRGMLSVDSTPGIGTLVAISLPSNRKN